MAAADLHIDIGAGPELSAATKTYTARLQALWLWVACWRGDDIGPAAAVPEALAEVLGDGRVTELADRYRHVQTLVTTGRGFSYPTAARRR